MSLRASRALLNMFWWSRETAPIKEIIDDWDLIEKSSVKSESSVYTMESVNVQVKMEPLHPILARLKDQELKMRKLKKQRKLPVKTKA